MNFQPHIQPAKRAARVALALLPITFCMFLLRVATTGSTSIGMNAPHPSAAIGIIKGESWTATKEAGCITSCSSNHVHQLTAVKQKQAAWLNQHSLFMRISRMDFNGVPGEILTNTYWHMMKAVTHHKYHPDSLAKQTA